MRGMTIAIIGIAVAVLIGIAVFMHGGNDPAPFASAPGAAPGAAGSEPRGSGGSMRSARVEDRLNQLRAEYERRDVNAANPAAREREVPTQPPAMREMVERVEREMEGGEDEDPEELAELRETLFNDPDPDERIGAILLLTGDEGPESMRMLIEAMDDPEAEVRVAVIEALGDRVEDFSPSLLNKPLRDPDPEVRFEAVSVLGDMEHPEALNLVRLALEDPDEDVRALAEGILDFSADDESDDARPDAH